MEKESEFKFIFAGNTTEIVENKNCIGQSRFQKY